MAKGIGLIGNFRGKVGNMVGYNLKDSNNKQTQGVRVYQPVVKNPKTYGQAEQRAKLAPINAFYRALKMVIDRGQEGKAYGNKSRLAWLSAAMKAFDGGWFEKGAAITAPALVPLTKGSLQNPFNLGTSPSVIAANFSGALSEVPTQISQVSGEFLGDNPSLQTGDQLTFITIGANDGVFGVAVVSFVLDEDNTDELPEGLEGKTTGVQAVNPFTTFLGGCIIVSREGSNGTHLRSTESIVKGSGYPSAVIGDEAKEAAVKSYMAAGANTDWAEESLQ